MNKISPYCTHTHTHTGIQSEKIQAWCCKSRHFLMVGGAVEPRAEPTDIPFLSK